MYFIDKDLVKYLTIVDLTQYVTRITLSIFNCLKKLVSRERIL